jgi:DNA-binding Lrp family transcriptional regulator
MTIAAVDELLAPAPLSAVDKLVLGRLRAFGQHSTLALATALRITENYAAERIEALCKAGLVRPGVTLNARLGGKSVTLWAHVEST